IAAIAGKSDRTRKRLEEFAKQAGHLSSGSPRLCPVGFTTEMDKYMAAADLLVGKAGGLTTSEALARALPMALIEPIPGQEERNADHLLEAGAAIRCNNFPAAAWKIARLLDDPARPNRMREAARSMRRPTLLIDADDTLWENNVFFEKLIEDFISLVESSGYTRAYIRHVLNETERKNIRQYGYGARSFGRSLEETYLKLAEHMAKR